MKAMNIILINALLFIILFIETHSMSQARILSRQPSIHNIQPKSQPPNKNLSQLDVYRLFSGHPISKFQLTDLKMHNIFYKKQIARYFLSLLQKWNRLIQQCDSSSFPTNTRTQFLIFQFIYLSLKRICIVTESEVDKQLKNLYNWFMNQAKSNSIFSSISMPSKMEQNQSYNVTKSFKTNPALIINQYRRKPFGIIDHNKNMKIKEIKNNLQSKYHNNFLTEVHQDKTKREYMKGNQHNMAQKRQQSKCLLFKRQSNKVRQQQLRDYLQKKQIQQQQWYFKLKKARLLSESSKNYFNGTFNTSLRAVKSSQGSRKQMQYKIEIQKRNPRVNTSHGKRGNSLNAIQDKQNGGSCLYQVSSFGLLSNPLQVKIKKKKRQRR